MFPGCSVEDFHDIGDSLVEHIQWVHLEEYCGLSLYCLSLVIELEVALADIAVRFVLMPLKHELARWLSPRYLILRTHLTYTGLAGRGLTDSAPSKIELPNLNVSVAVRCSESLEEGSLLRRR